MTNNTTVRRIRERVANPLAYAFADYKSDITALLAIIDGVFGHSESITDIDLVAENDAGYALGRKHGKGEMMDEIETLKARIREFTEVLQQVESEWGQPHEFEKSIGLACANADPQHGCDQCRIIARVKELAND